MGLFREGRMKIRRIVIMGCILVAPKINALSQSPERTFCNVNVGFGHPTQGSRCVFTDEVMTGIQSLDPFVILCSRVGVQCTRQEGAAEEVARELNPAPEK